MSNPKELKLSSNKVIVGVCGGIAEYLNMDPTIVRIIYAVLSVCTLGITGLVIYLIIYLILNNK